MYKDILMKLDVIYRALDELTLKGTKNCSILGAIASSMQQLMKDISEAQSKNADIKIKEE